MRISSVISAIATLALLAGQPVAAQQDEVRRAAPGSGELYKKLRAQCEQLSCAPSGGDACVEAAAFLMSETPPDEFWQMNPDQRMKIAVRLLEKGTNNSNRARARAYDLYTSFSLLGGFTDPYRANELMEMMTASGYPGAALRKVRASLSIFSSVSLEERAKGCAFARNLLARGGLDADAQRIAKEITEAGVCSPAEPRKE